MQINTEFSSLTTDERDELERLREQVRGFHTASASVHQHAWLERRYVEDELVCEEIRYKPMTPSERSQLEVMYSVEVLKIVLIPEDQ